MQQAVFAAIAAVVLMTGCPARNERPTARPAPVPTALPKDAVPVKGPPDALRARLEGAYTLGVDRRFLRAFDEVQRMARGAACAEQTAATRVEKGWTIAVCGESVGTLPMDPDFPDAIALLDAYASRIGRAHAVTGPARPVLPLLTADEALARVARLARPAAQGSRADVHVLAASLATLAFELPDRMEIADALAARALAAVVINRTLGGFETAREEALLAGPAVGARGGRRAARSTRRGRTRHGGGWAPALAGASRRGGQGREQRGCGPGGHREAAWPGRKCAGRALRRAEPPGRTRRSRVDDRGSPSGPPWTEGRRTGCGSRTT